MPLLLSFVVEPTRQLTFAGGNGHFNSDKSTFFSFSNL